MWIDEFFCTFWMINCYLESIIFHLYGQIVYFLIFCVIFRKIINEFLIVAFIIGFFLGRKNCSGAVNFTDCGDYLFYQPVLQLICKDLLIFVDYITAVLGNKANFAFYIFKILCNFGICRPLAGTKRISRFFSSW